MISPNRECPSMFLRDFYLSFYLHDKKVFFLTRRLIYSNSPIRIFTDIHSAPEFHF